MRKWLFMLVAGYLWKKYSARGATTPSTRADTSRRPWTTS